MTFSLDSWSLLPTWGHLQRTLHMSICIHANSSQWGPPANEVDTRYLAHARLINLYNGVRLQYYHSYLFHFLVPAVYTRLFVTGMITCIQANHYPRASVNGVGTRYLAHARLITLYNGARPQSYHFILFHFLLPFAFSRLIVTYIITCIQANYSPKEVSVNGSGYSIPHPCQAS